MTLQLDYAFVPSSYPIHASDSSGNPSIIGLDVIINNSTGLSVTISGISITIPSGDGSAGSLSTASLPAPVYDASQPWTITTNGSQLIIVPATGQSGEIGANSIVFSLPGIAVNEQPGTVQINIVEAMANGAKNTDDQTYTVVKVPTDFPVINFYANPAALNDLDQSVTIYWTGSDEVVYDLYSDTMSARGCLNSGECYTAADGAAGVATPSLVVSSIFTLDVIQPNSDGSHTLIASLTLSVSVLAPTLLQNTYAAPLGVYVGQPVFLHWVALNTASVTVMVDDVVYDANAPLDTYNTSYPVYMPNTTYPSATLRIIAYSISRHSQDEREFTISIQPPTQIDLSMLPSMTLPYSFILPVPNQAITLIVDQVTAVVIAINYDTNTIINNTLALNLNDVQAAVVTLDGQWALFAEIAESNARTVVVNIASWEIDVSKTLTTDDFLTTMFAHPSGSTIWIGSVGGSVGTIDLSTWVVTEVVYTLTNEINSLAITNDGKLMVVANGNAVTVFSFDNDTQTTVPLPQNTSKLVITPDDRSAIMLLEASFAILDIALGASSFTFTVVDLPNAPGDVAVTPNSQHAQIVMFASGTVMLVYDLVNQAVNNTLVTAQNQLFSGNVAITSNGLALYTVWLSTETSRYMLINGANALPPSLSLDYLTS